MLYAKNLPLPPEWPKGRKGEVPSAARWVKPTAKDAFAEVIPTASAWKVVVFAARPTLGRLGWVLRGAARIVPAPFPHLELEVARKGSWQTALAPVLGEIHRALDGGRLWVRSLRPGGEDRPPTEFKDEWTRVRVRARRARGELSARAREQEALAEAAAEEAGGGESGIAPLNAALAEAARAAIREVPSRPPEGFPPLLWARLAPHQRWGVGFALRAMGAGLAPIFIWEMGAGKTRLALGVAVAAEARRVLVVAPKSAAAVWAKEAALLKLGKIEKGSFPAAPRAYEGASSELLEAFRRIEVVNAHHLTGDSGFAKLERILEAPPVTGKTRLVVINDDKLSRDRWASRLLEVGWDLVIADESHRAKNGEAKRSRVVRKLAQAARVGALGLTGSPVSVGALDLFGIVDALNPGLFTDEEVQRYVDPSDPRRLLPGRPLRELAGRLRSFVSGMTMKAAGVELPPIRFERVRVPLAGPALGATAALERGVLELPGFDPVAVQNTLVKLQQLAAGAVLDEEGRVHELSTAKLDKVVELVDEARRAGSPVVVWIRFIHDGDRIARALKERLGIRVMRHYGAHAEWEAFQQGEGDALVISFSKGSEGIHLTRASRVVIFTPEFSLAVYRQALARVHRWGQERPVVVYELEAVPVGESADEVVSIDAATYGALARKAEVLRTVFTALTARAAGGKGGKGKAA